MSTETFQEDMLAGEVAFITGGGTGICRGIAEAYARHGCSTVIVSRKLEVLEAAAEEIEAAYGQPCLPVSADVREPERVEEAVEAALDEFGRLDVVINGAAGNFLCPAANLSYNGFRTVLEIDTAGTWNVTKAAFDAWLQDNGGHVLNISATLHYGATPFQLHASSAKAGVDAMVRNLAAEWGGLGIRVNAIAPGPVSDTEGVRRLVPDEMKEKIRGQIPLGRFAHIEDVAKAALFLSSDAAEFITGEILVVDGGHWLAGSRDMF